MQAEFKTPSIPFPVFNLLQTVIMDKFSDPLHGATTEEVFTHFKEKALDTGKPYPVQQFYPFLWLLTFAQTIATDTRPKLNITFKPELEDGGLGLYHPINHSINVKIMGDEEKIDSETIARVLMHESTHAMTHQIYGTIKPPEMFWGGEMGLAFRISLLSMFLSPAEGNFMQLSTATNKDQYTLDSYPNEFIAETIAYTIKNGELPLKDCLFPKDKEQLESAINAFLQDCNTYLDKLINESGLPKVMPWLAECDWSRPHLMLPLNELSFFLNFMRTGSLWQAAFISQDINIVKKIVSVQSTSYLSSTIFVFPTDVFVALPDSTFKFEVEQLLPPFYAVQPSAPSADLGAEQDSPSSVDLTWMGESSQPSTDFPPAFNPEAHTTLATQHVRFGFQPSHAEMPTPTAPAAVILSKL